MRNEAVATVAREEVGEGSRAAQHQGIGGLLCEYLTIMKEQQQESAKKGNQLGKQTPVGNDVGTSASTGQRNGGDSNAAGATCEESMEPQKTGESFDELITQPESAKIDNPVYRGCSTKVENDPGLEALPEIELFDSRSH